MIGVVVNAGAVLIGALIGILFRKSISDNISGAIMKAMGLITGLIGVQSAIKTEDTLCVIMCLVFGTVIGEWANINGRINKLGDNIKAHTSKTNDGNSRFTEGFVSTCILFCVGSMTIVGSLQAGISHNYDILFAKSVMDFISSIVFASAMGLGVACTSVFVLLFQGSITMLASSLSPILTTEIVTEMTAVGGVILMGMAINILDLYKNESIRVANMLPAIILPPFYVALVSLIS